MSTVAHAHAQQQHPHTTTTAFSFSALFAPGAVCAHPPSLVAWFVYALLGLQSTITILCRLHKSAREVTPLITPAVGLAVSSHVGL